jgi:uncharacterized membrane protein YeaQ/YmgE (transglycosylase-associated protein family)
MLNIIWYIIVGFIIGLIARAIMPGAQHLGVIMTTLLGIAGSIVGGFIGRLFSKPEPGSRFHLAGFILSIIGAIILLFVCMKLLDVGFKCTKPTLGALSGGNVTIREGGPPAGTTLRYTVDGSTPTKYYGTKKSPPAPWSVPVTTGRTLKAIVYKDWWLPSDVASRTY